MTLDWNRDKNPSCSLRIMAPKGLGHLAAQERLHKPEVPTLTKSGHQRDIFDKSHLLKTPELQNQISDFNETHIAFINYPCRPLQGGNNCIGQSTGINRVLKVIFLQESKPQLKSHSIVFAPSNICQRCITWLYPYYDNMIWQYHWYSSGDHILFRHFTTIWCDLPWL